MKFVEMIETIEQPQHTDIRPERESLHAAVAVRLAAKTVGGWLAAIIFLLTVSGALPTAINKICRATNRSVRITSGFVPARVDRRVDVIEPDSGPHGDPYGLTADDLNRARTRHDLPYRAAPFLARAVIRPSELQPNVQPYSYAPADAFASLALASYFPPHYNRPPPSGC